MLYSVLILYEKGRNKRGFMEYEPESIYFGEDEAMMRVKFFDAVRKAANEPKAISVTVWGDLEELVRVRVDH